MRAVPVVVCVAALVGCAAAKKVEHAAPDASVRRDAAIVSSDAFVQRDVATQDDASIDFEDAEVFDARTDALSSPDASVDLGVRLDAARDAVVVAVDAARDAAPDMTTVASGETCATPLVVAPGVLFAQTISTYAADLTSTSGGCKMGSGSDRVYRVTVPASHRLRAVGTPNDWDLMLNFVLPTASCAGVSASCLASEDSSVRGGETLTWANIGTSPQDILIVVDAYGATTGSSTFNLTITADPFIEGDLCENAIPMAANASTSGTLAGFIGDYGAGGLCAGTLGPDRIYKIDVPPGKELWAGVEQDSESPSFDPSINLMLGPASNCSVVPRTCLAGDDSGSEWSYNLVSYINETASTQTIFIAIESYDGSTGGFLLETTLD